jgi:anti-sigma B factor antagonist
MSVRVTGPRMPPRSHVTGPSGAPFEIRIQPAREAIRLKPIGELDLASAPELRKEIDQLVSVGFEHVIIDLRGLTFIDAVGLKLLLSLAEEAHAAGWRLVVIQGGSAVRRIFALTGTLEQLPFTPPSTR